MLQRSPYHQWPCLHPANGLDEVAHLDRVFDARFFFDSATDVDAEGADDGNHLSYIVGAEAPGEDNRNVRLGHDFGCEAQVDALPGAPERFAGVGVDEHGGSGNDTVHDIFGFLPFARAHNVNSLRRRLWIHLPLDTLDRIEKSTNDRSIDDAKHCDFNWDRGQCGDPLQLAVADETRALSLMNEPERIRSKLDCQFGIFGPR